MNEYDFIPTKGEPAHQDVLTDNYQDEHEKTEPGFERHAAAANRAHQRSFLEAIASRDRPVADIEEGYISSASCILANLSMHSHFFDKDHFASVRELKKKRRKFLRWYEDYAPPALGGLTVREANSTVKRRKLRQREIESLPAELPLTQGRIHFVRRVDQSGRIEISKESWRVSKTLKGEYVWATIDVKRQTLSLYHRRSLTAKARLVKQYPYQTEERVEKLQPKFRRRARRVSVLQVI